jgi:dCTP deaminase
MILSNTEIKFAITQGIISIDPLPQDDQYSGSSLDLHLGDEFSQWDEDKITEIAEGGLSNVVDASRASFAALRNQFLRPAEIESDGCCVIRPLDFLLGVTLETVVLPLESAIAARVEGRSSLARMGLAIHLTAPTIHIGWRGKIALELVNLGPWPIRLRPNELKVCQLIFERVGGLPSSGSESQFRGQSSPGGR